MVVGLLVSIAPVVFADNGRSMPDSSRTLRISVADSSDKQNKDKSDKAAQELEKKQERERKQIERLEKYRKNLEKFWEQTSKRLERLIENENELAERVDKRLDKAAANGKNVTALRAELKDARQLIADAEQALGDAGAKVEEVLKGTDTKVMFAKIRELQKGVLVKIRAAHAALVDVIKGTKGLGGGTVPTPSPTPIP